MEYCKQNIIIDNFQRYSLLPNNCKTNRFILSEDDKPVYINSLFVKKENHRHLVHLDVDILRTNEFIEFLSILLIFTWNSKSYKVIESKKTGDKNINNINNWNVSIKSFHIEITAMFDDCDVEQIDIETYVSGSNNYSMLSAYKNALDLYHALYNNKQRIILNEMLKFQLLDKYNPTSFTIALGFTHRYQSFEPIDEDRFDEVEDEYICLPDYGHEALILDDMDEDVIQYVIDIFKISLQEVARISIIYNRHMYIEHYRHERRFEEEINKRMIDRKLKDLICELETNPLFLSSFRQNAQIRKLIE